MPRLESGLTPGGIPEMAIFSKTARLVVLATVAWCALTAPGASSALAEHLGFGGVSNVSPATETFSSAGCGQTYTAPSSGTLEITATGAAGAAGGSAGGDGGAARATRAKLKGAE